MMFLNPIEIIGCTAIAGGLVALTLTGLPVTPLLDKLLMGAIAGVEVFTAYSLAKGVTKMVGFCAKKLKTNKAQKENIEQPQDEIEHNEIEHNEIEHNEIEHNEIEKDIFLDPQLHVVEAPENSDDEDSDYAPETDVVESDSEPELEAELEEEEVQGLQQDQNKDYFNSFAQEGQDQDVGYTVAAFAEPTAGHQAGNGMFLRRVRDLPIVENVVPAVEEPAKVAAPLLKKRGRWGKG